MRIMSIDPGTNCTGVSIIDYINEAPFVLMSETIKADKLAKKYKYVADVHGSRYARILATADRISLLLEQYNPDGIISESPYMGRFAQSFAALTELLSAIRDRVFEYDPALALNIIDPSTVKKFMGVKGTDGDKNNMLVALHKKQLLYSEYIVFDSLDEHAIDSICIGLFYINKLTSTNYGA